MFPLKELPKEFLSSMYNYSKYFSELQIQVIESNINRFLNKIENNNKQLFQLQYFVSKTYINRFKVKPIDVSQEVVGQYKLEVKLIKGKFNSYNYGIIFIYWTLYTNFKITSDIILQVKLIYISNLIQFSRYLSNNS